jgi:hypothetical protein
MKYSLLANIPLIISHFKREFGLTISAEFIACADMQLTSIFTNKTNIKFSNKVAGSSGDKTDFVFEEGKISRMSLYIFVNHNWNPVYILWKSHSGKIYRLDDTEIDCSDIEFWFEELDVELFRKQLYPKGGPSFKMKGLSFELICESGISRDSVFKCKVLENALTAFDTIPELADQFLKSHQEKSQKKQDGEGTISWWNWEKESPYLICNMDLGAANNSFIKKFLKHLSGMGVFESVEIT